MAIHRIFMVPSLFFNFLAIEKGALKKLFQFCHKISTNICCLFWFKSTAVVGSSVGPEEILVNNKCRKKNQIRKIKKRRAPFPFPNKFLNYCGTLKRRSIVIHFKRFFEKHIILEHFNA